MKRLILIAALTVAGCRYQYNTYTQAPCPASFQEGSEFPLSPAVDTPEPTPTPEKIPDMTSEKRALGMDKPAVIFVSPDANHPEVVINALGTFLWDGEEYAPMVSGGATK